MKVNDDEIAIIGVIDERTIGGEIHMEYVKLIFEQVL